MIAAIRRQPFYLGPLPLAYHTHLSSITLSAPALRRVNSGLTPHLTVNGDGAQISKG